MRQCPLKSLSLQASIDLRLIIDNVRWRAMVHETTGGMG